MELQCTRIWKQKQIPIVYFNNINVIQYYLQHLLIKNNNNLQIFINFYGNNKKYYNKKQINQPYQLSDFHIRISSLCGHLLYLIGNPHA